MFMVLISLDRPWVALLFGYAPSIPYNAVAAVGVWRSAARYDGPYAHADAARLVVVVLMVVLTVT